MAVFMVTTAADLVDAGDGVLSLREATAQANATTAADTVRFADSLDGRTLVLTGGQLTLSRDVTIEGAGSSITVDANQQGRAFAVSGTGTDVTLSDLGISGGYVQEGNGGGVLVGPGSSLALEGCTVSGNRVGYGFTVYASGGGVFAQAGSRVSVADSLFTDNLAIGYGGGIAAGDVALRIEDSRFLDNQGANGGAVALLDGSSLTLVRSLLSSNDAFAYRGGSGGGIYAGDGHVLVSSSTISDNRGGYEGSGIASVASTIDLVNATIADNTALSRLENGRGGAISGGGTLSLASSTVAGNYATNSLGIPGYFGTGGIDFSGPIRVANSLVLGNYAEGIQTDRRATDVQGTIAASNGHNIFGSDVAGSVAGDRENVTGFEIVGGLAFNGGPTPTEGLIASAANPALGGAEPVLAGGLDQRGFPRPQPDGTNPDIGAFERNQAEISRTPSAGNDVLTGSAAVNTLSGQAGADLLQGRGGNDRLNGGDDGDTLLGGFGADMLDGGGGLDTASYRDSGGAVTASLAARSSSGPLGVDRLVGVENLEGGRFADRLEGDVLANALGGGGGADRLFGLTGGDALLGGDGNDLLDGGLGADLLAGGAGADLFDYDRLADSAPGAANRDRALDFAHLSDRFDLATLDARVATATNDAFTFLAGEGATFTGAGQVRWFQNGGSTFVEANVDAGRGADLQIELAGLRTVSAADFIL